jgi:hypothetical protein
MAMTITAAGIGPDTKISCVPIKLGTHRYNLDSTDPLTAFQLKALQDAGLITFKDSLDPVIIEDVEDALNTGKLIAHTKKEKNKQGRMVVTEYHGSDTPRTLGLKKTKETKVTKNVGKSTKPTKGTGKNNN